MTRTKTAQQHQLHHTDLNDLKLSAGQYNASPFMDDDEATGDAQYSSTDIHPVVFNRHKLQGSLEDFFKLEKILSTTLYGCIYQAMYKSTSERVAIKASSKTLLHPESAQIFDDIESELIMHARIQRSCQPAAVKVRELYEDDDYLYVVMDLAEGGDLFNYVKRKHILHEDEVREIYRQLVQAVSCIHRHGIAHLDLSLENVVISTGEFKLCDFGVAREIDSTGDLLQSKNPCFRPGKPRYMSPEVTVGDFNGIAADVFSLGVILFCLLYGFHPFESPADFDPAYLSIMSNDFDSLLDMYHIRGEVSWEAEDLLSELLCLADVRLPNCEIILQHSWLSKPNATAGACA